MNEEERQRLAEAAEEAIEEPDVLPVAEREADVFGELREKHRHWQFWAIFVLALLVCIFFYGLFAWWVICRSNNWHVGLMLIIPPTTILLTLVQVLRHKKDKEKDTDIPPYSVQQLADAIKQIVQAIKS